MARFMLVCLDSESQIELGNADIHNLIWALKWADASGGHPDTRHTMVPTPGYPSTEYAKLHRRLAETFDGDVK